jgi:DNA-3-methyladenine glycosylase
MRIDAEFYKRDAVAVAPLLLGKILCRNVGGQTVRRRITETESYMQNDSACHAYCGKTNRNAVMFNSGGAAYVYLCYGIHEMLNIVTGEEGIGQAVLIRGVVGSNGPGKLTAALKIDRSLNGEDLTKSNELWLEDDGTEFDYEATKRVGIDYADEADRNRFWRFVAAGR